MGACTWSFWSCSRLREGIPHTRRSRDVAAEMSTSVAAATAAKSRKYKVHHSNPRSRRRFVDEDTGTGARIGIVGGAEQARLVGEVSEDFLLVPDMVARRNYVHPIAEQILSDAGGDTKAGSGVFAVSNHNINALSGPNVRQMVCHNATTSVTKNVTNEY